MNSKETILLTRTIRTRRIIAMICAFWLVWLPALALSTMLDARTLGPYSDEVKTIGVFKPGGFIEFVVNPHVLALGGRFQATIVVEPILDEEIQEKIKWPILEKEIRAGRWEETIADVGESAKGRVIEFVVSQDIPNDSLLSGQKISISFEAHILYPEGYTKEFFTNNTVDIYEDFEISLDGAGSSLSVWERDWFISLFLLWILGLPATFIGLLTSWKPKLLIPKHKLPTQ